MAKKRERRSYLNDFQKDLNGEYQYRGAHYHYDGALEYSKLRRSLWLRCGVGAALLVIAGCLPGATKGAAAYVTLPYMLALAVCGILLWTLARWTKGGAALRAYVYEQTAKRLPGLALAAGILSALAAVGQGIAFLTGSAANWANIAFFVCLAGAAALLLRTFAVLRRTAYRFTEADNQ